MITVKQFKEECCNRPIICPGTPNLYFCAVCEMDFDGPDYMGPPISDFVKTYYNGSPALALVYNMRKGGEDKTGRTALTAINQLGLQDNAPILLMDQDSGLTSEVTSMYSFMSMLFLISNKTTYR